MTLVDDLVSRFKAQLASEVVTAVAGAVLIVGLARLLDPDGYGLLFLALSVFGVFELVARLGIARSAGRYISEYKETDPTQLPHIVRTALLVNVATIGIAVLTLIVSYRYIVAVLGEPTLAPFLLLGAVFIALGASITFLQKVLQGFEAIEFVAVLEVIGRISRLVLALGLVIAGFGALGALWGYVLSALLTSAIGFGYLYRRVRRFRESASTIEPGLRRRIVEYAVPITATNTARVLDKRVDTLLVGYFLSPVAVSYYVLATQVVKFVETPMSALGFTLSPTFGAQKAAGNVGEISRIYETALVNALLLYIPAGAGMILVAEPMVHLVFGAEYRGAVVVLQVLALYAMLQAVTKITGNGLDYLGRARGRAVARGITGLLNVGLNVALIPTIGVVGAAVATVITYGLYTAANVYIVAQELELRATFLLKHLGVIAIIAGTMSTVVFALVGYISGWFTLALVVVIGGLVWVVLSVATGLLEVRKLVSVAT